MDDNFRWCVQQNCLTADAMAPCKTCPLEYTYGQQKFEMGASACGQCVVTECQYELMHCCADDPETDAGKWLVHQLVNECANPDFRPEGCLQALNMEAGAGDGCLWELPDCMRRKCLGPCTAGTQ